MSTARRRWVIAFWSLGSLLLLLVLYAALVVSHEGSIDALLEDELIVVTAFPDAGSLDIGGGWRVEFSYALDRDDPDPIEEGVRDPTLNVFSLYPKEEEDDRSGRIHYRRRRFQRYLPLHLIGID